MTDVSCVTCASCFAEAWGYTWPELAAEGWAREVARRTQLYLCPDCHRRYRESRQLEKLYRRPAAPEPVTSA